MPRMPFTTWDPAIDGNSSKACTPDIVCVHTIVGFPPAKAAHFSTRGDGFTWQHRDTTRQSAANYNGNGNVIAIENADHGPGFPAWNTNDGHVVPGFTAAQIEAIAIILVFCHRAHGIPLELIPDSRPGRRGVGYHRQGIDSPNNFAGYVYKGRVSGGVLWTKATGKVCPGDRRITQLINEIIPRARVLAGLDAPPEVDVNLTDPMASFFYGGTDQNVGAVLANTHNYAKATFTMMGAVVAEVSNDPDITEERIAEIVRANAPAVDPVALAAQLLGPLQETLAGLDSVSDEDAQQIAETTVQKFAERLGANPAA